jgi:hypothetical protein
VSHAQPSEEEIVQAVYSFAATQMQSGASNQQIVAMLIDKGLGPDAAATVVKNLGRMRTAAVAAAGKKNMAYGALWCIGGIVVTAATYGAAASAGGGTYVVAWGAIVFGAIQFIRGLVQAFGE